MPPTSPTFPQLFDQLVRPRAERVFLPRRSARDHSPISFSRLAKDVDSLASALLTLGIKHGDHVGLIAENRYEWLLIDQALASLGIVDVPRGSDTTPTELQFILAHSGCCAAFAEDDRVAAEMVSMQAKLPHLEHVIVMADSTEVEGARTLGELLASGEQAASQGAEKLREANGRFAAADWYGDGDDRLRHGTKERRAAGRWR